ncbi:uncharacterized protein I303_108231 [Kwoniella dejecticola CBS 10117]|uniref:Atypical/ABC1/ABC1-A protein kinase n=1 Tax=Kwoniella dejecticola CBS 10117 TaxID=1296121 RepID=A0A1A5ZXZ6_9TREE|nr:atypical/ABC1/ABC1-A protein kinase [Kwoniella dejecticola CBS 10117]OBR82679.1 atypical/ABC1/ABC1-A protein kinase [Kwoniella dejecticola CBS 10117]
MLSAAIRVVARSAAIQLEEVAALSAASSSQHQDKGKAKEIDPEEVEAVRAQVQTLSDLLHQHQLKSRQSSEHALPLSTSQPSGIKGSTGKKQLSALDRLIQASPRSPPPPAPATHPDRFIEAEQRKKAGLKPIPSSSISPPKQYAPVGGNASNRTQRKAPGGSIGLSLNDLIRASPRQNPPPAPDTHPDRHIEAEQSRKARILHTSVRPIPPVKPVITPSQQPEPTASAILSDQKSSIPSEEHIKVSFRSSPGPFEVPADSCSQAHASSHTTSRPPLEQLPQHPLADIDATSVMSSSSNTKQDDTQSPIPSQDAHNAMPIDTTREIESLGADPTSLKSQLDDDEVPVVLRASKVPSSRLGRLFHYGSLAASLSIGAASESLRRTTGGNTSGGSVFMSDANIRRLVATLGRMRGAALKLGQFMSIQDNHMLPPEIEKVLHQVQAHANYMPDWQMEKVMRDEFGSDWQSLFSSFDRTPIASASIGQVHRATLPDGREAAVKIQFPGVASSIESDLNNLSLLLRSSALLPKGLYLQNTIAVMRRELQDECDYIMEAAAGRRFSKLLENDQYFSVPKVVEEGTTGKVLTTEWMDGKPLSRVKNLSQETRDRIGTNILRLCLMELFQFRFMQTDPNWANFLYTIKGGQEGIQLIDFGASREYTKEFMDGWYRLLKSCLEGDRAKMKEESLSLGYLTGEENEVMVEAHLDSMALVASPFSHDGKYPFAKQTITDSIRALIPVMLKHRLTPPPQETYSLNRKLSGAFLMCAKLGANVDCQQLWREVVGDYREG